MMRVEATLSADLARKIREICYSTGWQPSRVVRVALWHYYDICQRQQPRLSGVTPTNRKREPWEKEQQDDLFDDFQGPIEGELL